MLGEGGGREGIIKKQYHLGKKLFVKKTATIVSFKGNSQTVFEQKLSKRLESHKKNNNISYDYHAFTQKREKHYLYLEVHYEEKTSFWWKHPFTME